MKLNNKQLYNSKKLILTQSLLPCDILYSGHMTNHAPVYICTISSNDGCTLLSNPASFSQLSVACWGYSMRCRRATATLCLLAHNILLLLLLQPLQLFYFPLFVNLILLNERVSHQLHKKFGNIIIFITCIQFVFRLGTTPFKNI